MVQLMPMELCFTFGVAGSANGNAHSTHTMDWLNDIEYLSSLC